MKPTDFDVLLERATDTAEDLGHIMSDWREVSDDDEPPVSYSLCLDCGATIQVVSSPRQIGGRAITLPCKECKNDR